MNTTLNKLKSKLHGYVDEDMLPQIEKENRLERLVVRTAKCRFTCAAQDAAYIISTLEKADEDNYCRDVSFEDAQLHDV